MQLSPDRFTSDEDNESRFNPEMLRLARGSQGKSQKEVANALGVSQGKISKWEDGLLVPSASEISSLATYLQYPTSFFYQSERVYGFGTCCIYHRKQSSLQVRLLDSIHDRSNVLRFGVARMLRNVQFDHELHFEPMDIDEFGSPAQIAGLLRSTWRLPFGPVRNLVEVIESAGGIVIPCAFGTDKLDAVSLWPPGTPPLFFINKLLPADRWRFSLAHELGHIIMHRRPSPNAEAEADQFASEFLMPARDIAPDLSDLTVPKALRLKHKWRVSMQAIIRRAKDTGAITPRKYTSLFSYLSKLGYRKQEPNPIEPESPSTVRRLIDVHLNELGYSEAELSELLFCTPDRLRNRYLGEERARLRVFNCSHDFDTE